MFSVRSCLSFLVILTLASAATLSAQTFATLIQFNQATGDQPAAPLVQGFDGNFYGTTSQGGAHLEGTAFKITSAGDFTSLYDFCSLPGCGDGGFPAAGLVQRANGEFYGT